jgi:site-specific DNA recombinase
MTPARVTSGPTLLTGICFCAKCGGAMTLRTGKGSAGGIYRYRTCSTKARQGKTGCEGRSIPMDRLDQLVAGHLEDRLLQPERLETILASVLDRRQERTERRREHLAELHKRITETDQRLNRLFDAIESGVADLDAHGLKERIAGLKAIRERPAPTPSAPRPRSTMPAIRLSAPIWSEPSPAQPASASGWTAAATAAITCGRWLSASTSRTPRSASWDRSPNSCAPCSPPPAENPA